MGAQELRQGPPPPVEVGARARGMTRAMTIGQVFDTLAVRLMQEQVGGLATTINWNFTDMAGTPDQSWVLALSNRTLLSTQGRHDDAADATIHIKRETLIDVITQATTFLQEMTDGAITVDGEASALLNIFGNLEKFVTGFAIVEP